MRQRYVLPLFVFPEVLSKDISARNANVNVHEEIFNKEQFHS